MVALWIVIVLLGGFALSSFLIAHGEREQRQHRYPGGPL